MAGGILGRTGAMTIAGALVCMAVLVGCTSPSATGPAPSTRSPGEPSADAPSPTATAESAWVPYTTRDGLATWSMPADWTVGPPAVDELGTATYDVDAPGGATRLVFQDKVMGLGGPGCIPGTRPAYPYQTLDHTDVPLPVMPSQYPGAVPPRVAYESIAFPGRVSIGLGITDGLQSTDGTACEFLHYVSTATAARIISFAAQYAAADGTWGDRTFADLDAAQAYRQTTEYRTLVRILASLQLRPAAAGLEGTYDIVETAQCGIFDLTGQVLTVRAGKATITTPGQTLAGTAVQQGARWVVSVSGAQSTRVDLTGTVSAGVYRGTGRYGGIHAGGQTGWTCDIPSFTASPR